MTHLQMGNGNLRGVEADEKSSPSNKCVSVERRDLFDRQHLDVGNFDVFDTKQADHVVLHTRAIFEQLVAVDCDERIPIAAPHKLVIEATSEPSEDRHETPFVDLYPTLLLYHIFLY